VKASYKWSASVKIAAGMTISAVTSPSHRISPRFTGKSTVQIETDDEYGGNRDYVLRYRLDGDEIETGLLLYEDPSGQGDNYFLLMAQPPKRTAPRAWVPREYIFVIDVSGSMSGFPLDTAKQIMRGLFAGLRTEDRFNMLFFSGGNQVMAEESVPATRENVHRAIDMLDGQRGGGGTELLGALRTALALPRRPEMATTVTVITDGYVTVEKETYALIRQSLGQASLFAFGTGSSVNRAIIEAMARAGMGEPFFALSPAEGRERAKELIRMVEAPLLSDVALELEGFDAYDVEPPTIPNLYASRPLIVFGKYRGRAGGELVIRGTDANGKLERTLRVADSEPSDDLVALRYLWARDRIERLSDDLSLAYDAETEKKITELGLSHRLMTAYTSFVAVDSQVRNRGEAPVEVRQPLPMPEGVSNQAIYGMSGFGHGGGASGSMNGSSMNSIGLGTLGTRGSGSGGGGFGGEGLLGGRGKSRELAISSGSPIVMGSLDKEVIRRVIRIHHGQIRYCYEKELLKNPGLGGKLVVELTIDAGGKVTKVEIKSSTMNNADVERCIAAKVQAWLFPKPAGGGVVIVRYPFVFRSE
jgi:Ca-activated chloride channel family protein